jgi:hypothetical protein
MCALKECLMCKAFFSFMGLKTPAFSREGSAKPKTLSDRGRVSMCLVLVGVALLMSACQPEFSLWVIPGSDASPQKTIPHWDLGSAESPSCFNISKASLHSLSRNL